jgi:hypothetical protein
MDRFGRTEFRDELDGNNIHRLGNIMTLDTRLQTSFDKLELWLDDDDVSKIETYRFVLISNFPDA